jgi:ribonuclease HI
MATLPKEHPLHKFIKQRRTGKVKRHKGPLHHLTKWFKVDANAIEKIPSAVQDPSKLGKIPLVISIAENREDSIKETEDALENLQIYSDGLALEGKVGAVAILILNGRHTQTLQFHLGSDTEHTVHEAELVGLLLSLHMLSSREYRGMPAMVGIDNQAAIKALASDLRSPGHHLVREALRIAGRLAKGGRKGKKKRKAVITIRWTAGHEGIEGNELADIEAKEAAKGCTSDTKHLPPYLRKPLLINPTAAKAAHNAALKSEWQNEWRNSKRGKAVAEIDESTPSSKFLKTISNPKLSRLEASRIAQIRLTHFPLNGYLKRIRKVDSARCPACGIDEETTEHFLLNCPSYAHERWTLIQLARKKHEALTLKALLGDPQFTLPLVAYIHATGRFMQPGERNETQNSDTAQ